jgi:large subunit ribosomal protein L24
MKIRTNDKVKIISGKDKGKTGKVIKVFKAEGRVVVEGVNVVKRHVKPGAVSKEGGIIKIERPISVSNVMYFDDKLGRPVKLGIKVVDGKFYRLNKKSQEVVAK